MDSLNTSTNVEEQNNKPSFEFENVEGSPFTIVKQEELYYGLIANHRITEAYTDIEELKEELLKFSWDRVTQVIWAVVEKFKHNEQQIKEALENE